MRIAHLILVAAIVFSLCTAAIAEDPILALKEKIIDLQNEGALGFKSFTLCTNVIGYGQYVPYPDNKVKAGSEI